MASAWRIFFSSAKKKFRWQKVRFRQRKIHFYYIKSSFRRQNFTFRQRIFFFAGEKKIHQADGIGISITLGFQTKKIVKSHADKNVDATLGKILTQCVQIITFVLMIYIFPHFIQVVMTNFNIIFYLIHILNKKN